VREELVRYPMYRDMSMCIRILWMINCWQNVGDKDRLADYRGDFSMPTCESTRVIWDQGTLGNCQDKTQKQEQIKFARIQLMYKSTKEKLGFCS
jgi:hypothetical protein